jgi:predicted phosphohydrolase
MIEVGDNVYHELHSGVCTAEADFFKIRVPQSELDGAKEYTVVFRASKRKKSYFTEFAPHQCARFAFRPIEKTDCLRIYHVADVHYNFELAKQTVDYFGKELNLFVINGDIAEAQEVENYHDEIIFLGDIGKGEVPMVVSRGNHDTRGRLAERYTDFLPAPSGNTYFTFTVGSLRGLVLDCGEDKNDKGPEYDNTDGVPYKYRGLNRFSEFRREQADFLKSLADRGEKFDFVVTHICPNMTTKEPGGQFDIEREVYTDWTRELERLKIKFMLCGHFHRTFVLDKNDERNIIPHTYPVIVASAVTPEDFVGGAFTYSPDRLEVAFTNSKHESLEAHTINLDN